MKDTKRKLKELYERKDFPVPQITNVENSEILSFIVGFSRLLAFGNVEAEEIMEKMLNQDLQQMKKFKNIDEAIENLTKIPNPLLIQCWRYKPNFKSVVELCYKREIKYVKQNGIWYIWSKKYGVEVINCGLFGEQFSIDIKSHYPNVG